MFLSLISDTASSPFLLAPDQTPLAAPSTSLQGLLLFFCFCISFLCRALFFCPFTPISSPHLVHAGPLAFRLRFPCVAVHSPFFFSFLPLCCCLSLVGSQRLYLPFHFRLHWCLSTSVSYVVLPAVTFVCNTCILQLYVCFPFGSACRAEVYAKSPMARADLKEAREGDNFIVDGGGYIYTCALNEIEPKGESVFDCFFHIFCMSIP